MKKLLLSAMAAVLPLSAALAEDDPQATVQQAQSFFQQQLGEEDPGPVDGAGSESGSTVPGEGNVEVPVNPFSSISH